MNYPYIARENPEDNAMPEVSSDPIVSLNDLQRRLNEKCYALDTEIKQFGDNSYQKDRFVKWQNSLVEHKKEIIDIRDEARVLDKSLSDVQPNNSDQADLENPKNILTLLLGSIPSCLNQVEELKALSQKSYVEAYQEQLKEYTGCFHPPNVAKTTVLKNFKGKKRPLKEYPVLLNVLSCFKGEILKDLEDFNLQRFFLKCSTQEDVDTDWVLSKAMQKIEVDCDAIETEQVEIECQIVQIKQNLMEESLKKQLKGNLKKQLEENLKEQKEKYQNMLDAAKAVYHFLEKFLSAKAEPVSEISQNQSDSTRNDGVLRSIQEIFKGENLLLEQSSEEEFENYCKRCQGIKTLFVFMKNASSDTKKHVIEQFESYDSQLEGWPVDSMIREIFLFVRSVIEKGLLKFESKRLNRYQDYVKVCAEMLQTHAKMGNFEEFKAHQVSLREKRYNVLTIAHSSNEQRSKDVINMVKKTKDLEKFLFWIEKELNESNVAPKGQEGYARNETLPDAARPSFGR